MRSKPRTFYVGYDIVHECWTVSEDGTASKDTDWNDTVIARFYTLDNPDGQMLAMMLQAMLNVSADMIEL